MAKIEVAQVKDGKKTWIPESWLEHPVLGKQFKRLPSSKAAETANSSEGDTSASAPSNSTAPRGSNKPKE